jgi:hypothetical protein
MKFQIPKGNFLSRSSTRTPSAPRGKEDIDTLTNYDFLVKKKIRQKNQQEKGFSASKINPWAGAEVLVG